MTMFEKIRFRPGAVVSPAVITIPSYAPSIDAVVSAKIIRITNCTIDDHAAADVIASIDDHAVHGHAFVTAAGAGGGAAVTIEAGPPVIVADGAGHTIAAGGVTGVQNLAAAQAHAATATDVAHTVITATLEVAATPTKDSATTFHLNVSTLVQDELELVYIPVGARLQVS